MELNTKLSAAQYHELPFVASTSLDWFLGAEVAPTTLQKRRVAIRSALGLGDVVLPWMDKQSVGGMGSFQLVPSSVLLCLQTDMRWQKAPYFQTLTQSFTAHGLPDLMQSATFMALSEMMVQTVKTLVKRNRMTQSSNVGRVVNGAIRELSLKTPILRAAAADYSRIVDQVVSETPQVDRLPGHVVRVEGSEALIAVDTAAGKDLRWINAELLETFGLDEIDAPFVLLEQHWSPDARTSYFQPAIVDGDVSSDQLTEIEQRVRTEQNPLRAAVVPVY